MAPRSTPHDEESGFVSARENTLTRGWTVLYDGTLAGFSCDNGKWHLFCAEHGALIPKTNKAAAIKELKSPEKWCNQCRSVKIHRDSPPTSRAVKLNQKTPESVNREMRFWASKAKNSPEKQILFEKMYGVAASLYWD